MQLAMQHGFYIEAAMICESLLADRLHSHLHWRVHEAKLHEASYFGKYAKCLKYGPDEVVTGKDAFVPFGALIAMYAKCLHDDHRPEHPNPPRWVSAKKTVSPALLKHWSEQRNAIAHGAVKTHPTHKSYAENFETFEKRAQDCAEIGVLLAKLINGWDAAVRRAQERQSK